MTTAPTSSPGSTLASIPSPSVSQLHLGPFTVHLYALCIIAGVVAAVVVTQRRWSARGGGAGEVADVATWAVPFGLLGGRLYHVITDPELYFGKGKHPVDALYIWKGGLGIWGAIALGGVGAWIACRRRGIRLPPFADAAAPGIVLAQAIGRFGNYFNQELYGRPTTLPWALQIDAAHRPANSPRVGLYQPTFLYEVLWDVGVAGLVVWADRRWRLGRGRAFALYVAAYTVGRAWIEALRIDHANHVFGLRLNDWVALLAFLGSVGYLWLRRGRPRETPAELYRADRKPADDRMAEEGTPAAASADPASSAVPPEEAAGSSAGPRPG